MIINSDIKLLPRIALAITLFIAMAVSNPVHSGLITMEPAATAVTTDFTVDGNKLPISSTTTFFNIWANPDPTNTAQHEVGHALGFTVIYELFNDNVSLIGSGPNRQYKDGDDGTVLAQLVPAQDGTHMITGVTVDGNNQTNDIMRMDQVVGQRWGAQDTKILQDAFDWQLKDIWLTIDFIGSWSELQRLTIMNAANAVADDLGTLGATGHAFTWTVKKESVPVPGTLVLILLGAVVGLTFRSSRRPC